MARTWSECIRSSKKAAVNYDKGQLQIGRDALEAIPNGKRGVDHGIKKKIAEYANEIGVEAKTLERWRSVAQFFEGLIEFPPTGGFSKVTYSAYRELHDRYEEPEEAFALLQAAMESGPPPGKSGRWTKKDITAWMPKREPQKKAADAAEDKPTTDKPTTVALTADLLKEAALSEKRGEGSDAEGVGDTDQTLAMELASPAKRIVALIHAVLDELPLIEANLEAETFEELHGHVEDALALAMDALAASQVGGAEA